MQSGWVLAVIVFTVVIGIAIVLEVSPRAGGVLLFLVVMVLLSHGLARQTIQPVK